MSIQTLHAVSVRHGTIEDNGLNWAKVGTLSEEVQDKQGFQGQQFVEYSVDSSKAKVLATKLNGKLPASLDFKIGIKIEKGKPMMVLEDLAE